jgi:hypothetical protein
MTAFDLAFHAAATGPVAEGDLISLRHNARLRVTYNWLYSALNVDPNDGSPFPWILDKFNKTNVSLSPKNSSQGRPLYASVRSNIGDRVQVEAPQFPGQGSLINEPTEWVTTVARDETFVMVPLGFLLVRFIGENGRLLNVDEGITAQDDHAGYLVKSSGSLPANQESYTWFFAVRSVLQPNLQIQPVDHLTQSDIRNAFVSAGLESGDARVAGFHALLQ